MQYDPAKIQKLEKLLRYHRARVFDAKTGDAHGRAIDRLKRSQTFAALCQYNRDLESIHAGESLTRMGY